MRMVDLEPDDPRLAADLLPVLRELRPHLTPELLAQIYAEGRPQGLRFTAAYDDSGTCTGASGWRVIAGTSTIRKLYVDDLVTAEHARSTGVGRELLTYLEARARELGCHVLDLDSGTQRAGAHRFYLRERMNITSFHFAKALD